LRFDFLIANFLAWFNKLGNDSRLLNAVDYEKCKRELDIVASEELSTVIPNIFRTGIELIDLAFKPLEKKNILDA